LREVDAVPANIPIGNAATPYDFALRFAGAAFDFAGWSGDPSIAALSVNPGQSKDRRDVPKPDLGLTYVAPGVGSSLNKLARRLRRAGGLVICLLPSAV
jgi:hypothetical protein